MNIYIAAPFHEQKLAKRVAGALEERGFKIVSSWIKRDSTLPALGNIREATKNMNDLEKSDLLVLLNTQKRGLETSGKQVELGVALHKGIPTVMWGDISNVFHHLVVQSVPLSELYDAVCKIRDAKTQAQQANG